MPRAVHLSLALLALQAAGAIALAQPAPTAPTPGDEGLQVSKRHFTQGVALYNEGNFNAALAEFEAANVAHPQAAFLYNIGLCQKGLFRYVESIETLGRYLSESASSPKPLALERKSEVQQMITEMRALLVDVALTVVPDGAAVIVDGRSFGTSPLHPLGLAAGHHLIEVTADGYKPVRKELTLAAGVAPMVLRLELEPIPKTGRAHIFSPGGNPTVKIDGRVIGPAPVDVELGLGGHSLEVSSPGFVTSYTELVLAPGQARTVAVNLERPKRFRLYEKWWFWSLGVLVLGGAVAGLVVWSQSGIELPIMGTLGTSRIP